MKYNYIDDTVKIDFSVSNDLKYLMDKCEYEDLYGNYGTYEPCAEMLVYVMAKEACRAGHITREQWKQLEIRYQL